MAITVTIQGTSYSIPQQGANPPWGTDLTDLLEALVSAVNSQSGTGDLLLTSFDIANNQVAAANVTGASFNTSSVRSAIISYSVYRSTASSEVSECGHIYVTYKSTASSWEIAQSKVGESSVVFSMTTAGQLQYTSSNIAGASYSGKMKFLARAFLQV